MHGIGREPQNRDPSRFRPFLIKGQHGLVQGPAQLEGLLFSDPREVGLVAEDLGDAHLSHERFQIVASRKGQFGQFQFWQQPQVPGWHLQGSRGDDLADRPSPRDRATARKRGNHPMEADRNGAAPRQPRVMKLFFLTCLLAVFPVASTKSPIFSPPEVHQLEGRSTLIRCFYPSSSVNRHTRKYWCRQGETTGSSCKTIVSTPSYVSKDYEGRVSIVDFPEKNTFEVNIVDLSVSDSGKYKCGLGINGQGLSSDTELVVYPAVELSGDTEIHTAVPSESLLTECFTRADDGRKYLHWKPAKGSSYSFIADSNGYVTPKYKDRLQFTTKGTTGKFTITIKPLQPSDAGSFKCSLSGNPSNKGVKEFELQMLAPEAGLAYADLRGSATVRCALGSDVAGQAKFLCRMNKEKKCEVVVNTLGVKAQAFVGRVLLTVEDSGAFSVLMVGLRKEDTGRYLCGAHSSGLPQEDAPTQTWHLFVNEETQIPPVPSVVKGVEGGSVVVRCPYDPKEQSSQRYWCRWKNTNTGDCPLLVQSEGVVQGQLEDYEGRLALFEEPGNGIYTVVLNRLTARDAGFYWCQSGGNDHWTTVVELKVNEVSQGGSQVNAAPGEVSGPSFRETEDTVYQDPGLIQEPRLFAEDRAVKDAGSLDDGNRASSEASSSVGQGGTSTILVSTLVPLAMVLTLGAVALAVARARHRRNVDRLSIRSYRTDISMSDLENSRDFGGHDNMGASPENQETSLGKKDEASTTTENTMETENDKKAKRSSKEEADMAYSDFVFQSKNLAASIHSSPSEA